MNFIQALFYFESPQATYWQEHPNWPKWLVYAGWWFRNPFPGVTEFILGLPKPCTSTGTCPGVDWNPKGGFNFLTVTGGGKSRPFISYRGKLIEGYFGWKPSGSFGIALRKANAKPETGAHVS